MTAAEQLEADVRVEHALERCEAAGSPAYAEIAAKEVRRLRLALEITKSAAEKIVEAARAVVDCGCPIPGPHTANGTCARCEALDVLIDILPEPPEAT